MQLFEVEQLLCLSNGLHIKKKPLCGQIWSNKTSSDTEDVIDEFLAPQNVGIDTNIVLLGHLEQKFYGKT